MKTPRILSRLMPARLFGAILCSLPVLASAHPGHYHPDETDEFDFVRSTFLHSHGALDYLLAGVAVASVTVACMNGKRPVRVMAILVALGSLAVIPLV